MAGVARRHELRLHEAAVETVKRARRGAARVERVKPYSLEVDSVGEHEVGVSIDIGGGDD